MPAAVGHGVKELPHHLRLQIPHLLPVQGQVADQIRPSAEIQGAQHQGLVHGKDLACHSGAIPFLSPTACAMAWPSTMPVSSTVWWVSTSRSPSTCTAQIKKAVAGKAVQHVVEKSDSGVDIGLPAPVQVQACMLIFVSLVFRARCVAIVVLIFTAPSCALLKPHADGIGVGRQMLGLRKGLDVLVGLLQGLPGIVDDAGFLDKIVHAQGGEEFSRAVGGQNVVGPREIVPQRLGAVFPDER